MGNWLKKNITCDMITLYEFHEYILSYHNILDFWNAKKLASQFISYNCGFIYLLKCLFEWFFNIKNNVMPLMQRKFFLKDFENHKLKYTMKYGIF